MVSRPAGRRWQGSIPEGGALAIPRLSPVGTCEWNIPGPGVPRVFPGCQNKLASYVSLQDQAGQAEESFAILMGVWGE